MFKGVLKTIGCDSGFAEGSGSGDGYDSDTGKQLSPAKSALKGGNKAFNEAVEQWRKISTSTKELATYKRWPNGEIIEETDFGIREQTPEWFQGRTKEYVDAVQAMELAMEKLQAKSNEANKVLRSSRPTIDGERRTLRVDEKRWGLLFGLLHSGNNPHQIYRSSKQLKLEFSTLLQDALDWLELKDLMIDHIVEEGTEMPKRLLRQHRKRLQQRKEQAEKKRDQERLQQQHEFDYYAGIGSAVDPADIPAPLTQSMTPTSIAESSRGPRHPHADTREANVENPHYHTL